MAGDLLTTAEAAARLGVDPATVRRAIAAGELVAISTPGGHHRIAEAAIEAYLHRGEPARATTVLAVATQKGGAAKTTTAVALAAALVDRGLAVLLVDCDPQSNATDAVGFDRREPYPSLYHAMKAYLDSGAVGLPVVELERGFDLVPSHLHLASMETALVMQAVNKATVLRTLLEATTDRRRYDWVILDCPPSLGWLTINAFTAADTLLIPQIPDFISAQGLGQLAETIQMVRTRIKDGHRGEHLAVAGVLLVRVRAHLDHHQQMRTQIAAFCDSAGFPFLSARSEAERAADPPDQVEIPDTIGVADAAGQAVAVSRYPAAGDARRAYRKLAGLLLAGAATEEPSFVR